MTRSTTDKLEMLSAIVGSEDDPDGKLLLATTLFALVVNNLVRSADKPRLVDAATGALTEVVHASECAIRSWGGQRPQDGRHAVALAVGLLEMCGQHMRYEVDSAPQVATLYRMLSASLLRVAEQLEQGDSPPTLAN